MPELFLQSNIQTFLPLLLAFVLGALLGLERELSGKAAGLRTYALVALGAALFALVAKESFLQLAAEQGTRLDLGNVIAAIAVGLGFLGAGLIVRHETNIWGLTSAAGVWATGAIGVSVGLGFYSTAVFATILVLFVFSVLRMFEKEVIHRGK